MPFLQHHKPHQRTTHLGLIREVILQKGKQKKKGGKNFDTVEMNKRLRHLTFLSPLKKFTCHSKWPLMGLIPGTLGWRRQSQSQ